MTVAEWVTILVVLSLVGGIIAAVRQRFLLSAGILAIGVAALVQAAATGVGS